MPACWRIWFLVKLTISAAMSVSRIRDSEADRFSVVTCKLLIVDSNRFWVAPRAPRAAEIVAIAVSVSSMMARASSASAMLAPMTTAESIVDLAERLTPIVARCSALSDLTIRALLQPTFITVEHSLTLCRIAREALNNVGRHSDASVVDVRLVAEPAVTLSIHDNGTGFDPTMVTSDHYGLSIMQERSAEINADFSIDSSPGKGTTITVSLAE